MHCIKGKFHELSLRKLQGLVAVPCSWGQRQLHSLSSSPLLTLDKLFHLAAPQFPHLDIRIMIRLLPQWSNARSADEEGQRQALLFNIINIHTIVQ